MFLLIVYNLHKKYKNMKCNFLKMLSIALFALNLTACVDNVPKEEVLPRDAVSFDYYIDQTTDKYYLDFYVGSDINFINTSPETTQGNPTWDFGDGSAPVVGDTAVHYYTKAGTYNVKLTVGEFSKTQVVMIAAIKPIVTYDLSNEECEVRKTLVSFKVELPNPKNLPASFEWFFPEDTKDSLNLDVDSVIPFDASFTYDKDSNVVMEIPLPQPVKMWHVGSLPVRLEVNLGGSQLESTIVNVQVGYDTPVPTLYYAVQGGRIMAHKLTNGTEPKDMIINSFDLGVAAGQHPFNILFNDSVIYVLDAGKQFYYVNDVNGVLGDGKISVVSKDGKKVETMISNAGQAAFDDPFFGFIEGNYLYYANRNTGFMKVRLTDRDKMYSEAEYPYHVRHNRLHYYGAGGLAYGAVSCNFAKIKGVWHWATCHTATAVFRFTDAQIEKDQMSAGDPAILKTYPGKVCDGMKVRSFVYVPKHDKVVFCVMETNCNDVCVCTYEEWEKIASQGDAKKKAVTYNKMSFASNLDGNIPSVEGTGVESVGITQIVYDEVNDCVYFAYRNNGKKTEEYPETGIYSYSFTTNEVTQVIKGISVYGLTINNKPAKLF